MSQLRNPARSFVRLSAMVAAITLVGAGSAQAAYINDGSFETPHLQSNNYLYNYSAGFNPGPGVTFANNSGVANTVFSSAAAPDGTQYGFVQSGSPSGLPSAGSITFDVTGLTVGATYGVSFLGSLRAGYGADPVQVLFNSVALGLFMPTASDAFQNFTTDYFVATGSTGSLEFLGTTTTGDVETSLDHVLVNLISDATPISNPTPIGTGTVPEPAPIALMGLSIIAGFLARRRAVAAKRG